MKRSITLACYYVAATLTMVLLPLTVNAQSDWAFTVLPGDDAISASPGASAGWGYSFSNLSDTHWLWVLFAQEGGSVEHGVIDFGVYDSPILPPLSSLTIPWSEWSGLATITWDSDAPIGYTTSGEFSTDAFWFDGDPFLGGQYVDYAGTRYGGYSATVVPEPGLLPLLGAWVVPLVRFLLRRSV